ncbi:MAG: isoaspartyl peptidase/L-asparaginase family protein [candidate division WOR-3 bacterium]
MGNFGIIVHGGAGKHRDRERAKEGVIKACEEGYKILEKNGSAIDAVCAAVCEMENNPYFNAGYGASPNHYCEIELDAAIMVGNDLRFGGVAGIKGFKNPILIARKVMEKTPHLLLSGEGAEEFAISEGFKRENLLTSEKLSMYEKAINEGKDFLQHVFSGDTVGACAVDRNGIIVAGTSTGGIFLKMKGRIGDTPCIGCGTYANSLCAVSATGFGESIMRVVLAKFICDKVIEGKDISEACRIGIEELEKNTKGLAGVIGITISCEFGFYKNTETMPVAFIKKGDKNINFEI